MYAKKFLDAIGETKEKDSSVRISELTKGTMVGASVGAMVGLFIGFGRKKSLLMSGFIGSLIGAAVSRAFIVKK
jgi:uncharacterized membrane protein